MASGFVYKKRSEDSWRKRENQQGGDFIGVIKSDYKTYTVHDGDNYIRILPPTWSDAEHYGLDVYVHYGVGPDRGSVMCLHRMRGERCPICEAEAKARKAGDEELTNELKATKRVAVWMLDRKDPDAGPQIWVMPWTLDRDFVKIGRDRDTGEVYAFDDPEDGYDISFERIGKQRQTKYTGAQLARRRSSVSQDVIDYIVLEPLTEAFIYLDYDEIKALFEGGGAPPPEDDGAKRDDTRGRDDQRGGDTRREDTRRDDTRRDDTDRPAFKPRGSAARDEGPRESDSRSSERDTRSEDTSRQTDTRETREPPADRSERQEPRSEQPSGRSRADELRAKFGNRK